MTHRLLTIDDRAMIERYRKEWDQQAGPRVGDFVQMLDGTLRRFAHSWDHGIQTTCAGGLANDQSFYHGGSVVSFSGSLDRSIPFLWLERTNKMRNGAFWTFHHGEHRAHNGVSFTLRCRVFRQLDHARTAPEGDPELHAVNPATGHRLRHATPDEVRAWAEQPVRHPAFRQAILVGDVLVDEYAGPGVSHLSTDQPYD